MNGIKLELFLDEPDVSFEIQSGFQIFITDQGKVPDSLETGIFAPAGFGTNIVLSKETNKREPIPYSDCTADLTSIHAYNSDLYRKTFQSSNGYAYGNCLFTCVQKTIEEAKTKSKDVASQITAQNAQDIINILLKGVE